MKCVVCRALIHRGYCGACVQDRVKQHEWLAARAAAASAGDGAAQTLAGNVQSFYDYQAARLRIRRRRVAALRARVLARQQQVSAAERLRTEMAQRNDVRRAQLQADDDTHQLESMVDDAGEGAGRSSGKCKRAVATLRKDRGILAGALCEVVGLQLRAPGPGDGFEMYDQSRLFGMPWPGREDWVKYPNDYINACVGHCIHVFSVMARYLHLPLPFVVIKRGAALLIRPSERTADMGEAALTIADATRPSFIVGLSMLFFDIAFMCHCQGVRVPVDQAADAVENMRQAVLALDHHENDIARAPFSLDLYAVVQDVLQMYADPERPDANFDLRARVHDVLGRLHLCSDAVDAADLEDENWAII
ncbi:hypothetical protein GGF46_002208 [Coemansia sp. RSA 552]|nr:hypothetical protein GGF46_002208 [Coemansia sp. RSA 552]